MMETSAPRRPWEATSSSPSYPQQLPSISTLTRDVDSRVNEKSALMTPRDSTGSWTGTTGVLSATSTTSTNTMPFLNSSTNHSPSHPTHPYTPTELNHPSSAFSSTRNSTVPYHNHSVDLSQHRGSGDYDDSRRGSVESRMYHDMTSLRLGGPTSPYNQSANASQSSLTSSLQQQRGITGSLRHSAGSGLASPHWSRNGVPRSLESRVAGRIAPPIMEHPRTEASFGPEPVKGQPWAFPDPDLDDRPSTTSRRNSQASFSTTASIYSEFARPLPVGQHELPHSVYHGHGFPPDTDRVSSLKGEGDSPNSQTPYSRTPELRVTHKLAERKRRSEMKDSFEQLRTKLPTVQSNKSSKWETLARAIDYIDSLESQTQKQRNEVDRQRDQIHQMEMQIKELSARNGSSGNYPLPPNSIPYSNGHYTNGIDTESSRTLPPIMNGGAMQGVQYAENGR